MSDFKDQVNSEVDVSKTFSPDVSCQTGHSDNNAFCLTEFDDQNGKSSQNEPVGEIEVIPTSSDNLFGDHEIQVSEGGEADLHKHIIDCKKNPGHTQFIPVHTFTLNHLPEGHRDNDLYEYIIATAALTVRINANMTSPDRPEFWPNTKVSYPFYNTSNKTNLRSGSGMVRSRVDKFTDGYSSDVLYGDKHWMDYTTCWCKKCLHSETPNHVWWEFDVFTATHVVFDAIEASHISLRLFYDAEKCPLFSVDQVRVVDVNIESDWCLLKCVTCDANLGDKLVMLWDRYVNVLRKVNNKYSESRGVDKLSFIVSHPHGCCKQISVGHWVDKYEVGNYDKFTYTTCTCPGSSGATVHCVGYDGGVDGWWWYPPVHIGSLNSNLNYSGAGQVL